MSARLTLRARMAVVYSLVVAGMLVLFGLLLYFVLQGALQQDIDQKLTWRTQQVKAVLWPSTGGSLTVADVPLDKLDLSPLESLAAPGLYVRVFDTQGE